MAERTDGFYWVRGQEDSQWQVAEWADMGSDFSVWRYTGDDQFYEDAHFHKIDERRIERVPINITYGVYELQQNPELVPANLQRAYALWSEFYAFSEATSSWSWHNNRMQLRITDDDVWMQFNSGSRPEIVKDDGAVTAMSSPHSLRVDVRGTDEDPTMFKITAYGPWPTVVEGKDGPLKDQEVSLAMIEKLKGGMV